MIRNGSTNLRRGCTVASDARWPRAIPGPALPGALEFFLLFFAGTLVWFLPFLGVSVVRRFTGLRTVASFTTLLVAAYYGYLGVITLGGALLHAWHNHA